MADHTGDRDGAEIDDLVRELMTKRFEAAKTAAPRPVSRWSNIRMRMPSAPAASAHRGASAPAISLPLLPHVRDMFRLPGEVTMARMWVGLGAVYAAAMTYWPYPKTYWLGLLLYFLSLGLVLVSGIWGARLSWDARLGTAHTIALGTVAWAIGLAAAVMWPLMP
jgi:hypothetical protein